jgi:hypothetical protein
VEPFAAPYFSNGPHPGAVPTHAPDLVTGLIAVEAQGLGCRRRHVTPQILDRWTAPQMD